ncbi:MAG: sulfur carrier protein [Myxococcota bacterium]|jgi:sulfur carrier protein
MQITLNGQPRDLPEQASIADLLTALEVDPIGVAVALNLQVVPRGEHAGRLLVAGDRIDIIRAVGGG